MKTKNKLIVVFLIALSVLLFAVEEVFTDDINLPTLAVPSADTTCLWGQETGSNDIYAKDSLLGSGVAIGTEVTTARPFTVYGMPVANGANRTVANFMDNSALAAGTGGGIAFGGHSTDTVYSEWAGIKSIKDNAASGDTAAAMAFMTKANGSPPAERMRITSSGDVYIGPLIPPGLEGKLHIDGSIALRDGNADGPQIRLYDSPGATPWEIDNDSSILRFSRGISTDPTRTKMMITSAGNVGIGMNPDDVREFDAGLWEWNGEYELAVKGVTVGVDENGNPIKHGLFVSGNVMTNGIWHMEGDFYATKEKSFKIDHPTKPGMKLIHACIEGPEAAVFYRGEARLTSGRATVELPDYFEALTHAPVPPKSGTVRGSAPRGSTRKDTRTIWLTAKGKEPFLLSHTDIVNGKFNVYGTKPDGEFCWEVKAVRADIEPLVVEKAIGDYSNEKKK